MIKLDYMQKRLIKIYIWIFAIGFGYFLLVSPLGIKVPCIFNETTGFLCPGCGITRMFLSLIRLDIASAFNYNSVCLVLVLFWLLLSVLLFVGKPKLLRKASVIRIFFFATIAVLVVFGFVRNII